MFKWMLAFVALLVVFQAYRISQDAGVFVQVKPVGFGQCEEIPGPSGSEDITIDEKARVAFISSGNGLEVFEQYRTGHSRPVASGDIWLLDLNNRNSTAKRLNVNIDGPFHPHGIDLLVLENGARELYVINHPNLSQHEVLIFDVSADHQLRLKRRIHYPEMISPNDITAVASERFLVTNDHGYPRSSVMFMLEDYLGLPLASVSYFNGNKGALAIKGLRSANGITLSKDNNTLYVAEATARRIKRFSRGQDNRSWQLQETLFVDTAVDNLEWDGEDHLLVAGHPNLFKFLGHIQDVNSLAPSHVIRINVKSSPMSFETIYMNSGDEISGSSVGAKLGDELLVGAVLERHFLRCRKVE